ncbi:MAG: carbon storage regulator, partial [Acidobacteriota bacterium]|nr:carbon storage regulator [Acidobacteriota bacterium]
RITVSVCEIRGQRVRLGFEAPPDVAINRGEVQTLVDRDGQRRVAPKPSNTF